MRRTTPVRGLCLVVGLHVVVGLVRAHGAGGGGSVGHGLHLVTGVSVGLSLLGGAALVAGSRRWYRSVQTDLVCVLLLALGGIATVLAATERPAVAVGGAVGGVAAVSVARGYSLTDCGTCADAALGAVVLHRFVEGGVLATVYAANAAVGTAGAIVLAGHATAETAAVGSLYATTSRAHAVAAALLVQAGFVAGVLGGVAVVGAVPTAVRVALLGFVGGVLVTVGAYETRHTARVPALA
jgi:hypothetical protein